ncbi:NAD(P)-dependent oxidoreductase [Paenibacillus roseipurpureus]|uniref:NAD(P)-dependent oxidoreductase n=1 Tax=Paenibacillus roseopurpureus TaxID=2918901 RepID=A0AA96LRX0_9BACL|nr:NAD(P)-dependent oxidoreductase [Paenibacillus sp. MBLB1832]WNR46107.1 NAD(P)-dependent oxidoreductase [Paenibacillus sp. MBLB1832]
MKAKEEIGMRRLAFSTLPCEGWSIEEMIALAKSLGFNGIELREGAGWGISSEMTEHQRREVLRQFKEAGLEITNIGSAVCFTGSSGDEEQFANFQEVVSLAYDLQARGVRIFLGYFNKRKDNRMIPIPYDTIVTRIKQACAWAASFGIQVWIETHNEFATGRELRKLLDDVDMPNCAVIYDIIHPLEAGESPLETITLLGAQCVHVHIKDGAPSADPMDLEWIYTKLGEGQIPITTIVNQLEEAGYSGCYSLEWERKWRKELQVPGMEPAVIFPAYLELMRSIFNSEMNEEYTMKTLITIANEGLRDLFWQEAAMKKLENFSQVDIIPLHERFTSEDLAEIIGEYDACITSWGSPSFTPNVLARAEKLRFIGHGAGSVAAIVNEDVFHTPIAVTSANKVLALSTAECAVSLFFAGAWDHAGYSARLKGGQWSNNTRETVLGVTRRVVGLIGYGEISKQVIRMLQPFNVTILLHSSYCSREEAIARGVELVGLNELFERSDIISLHNTWTSQSEGMIGRDQLKLMRDGTLFVNTARGPIVQERALVEELRKGRIFAALDVYEHEPLPKNHELLTLPNVLCLPHIGGYHGLLKRELCDFIVDELHRFVKGEALLGQVSLEHYRRLTPR